MSRPMTSTRGVGFTSMGGKGSKYWEQGSHFQNNVYLYHACFSVLAGGFFDPLNQSALASGRPPIPPLTSVPEDSPEEAIRQLEKKVNMLLEESAEASVRGDAQLVRTIPGRGMGL